MGLIGLEAINEHVCSARNDAFNCPLLFSKPRAWLFVLVSCVLPFAGDGDRRFHNVCWRKAPLTHSCNLFAAGQKCYLGEKSPTHFR